MDGDLMIEKLNASGIKTFILQSITLVLILTGAALAVEHRLTAVETTQKNESSVRVDADNKMLDMIKVMQATQIEMIKSQERVAGMLDMIDPYHVKIKADGQKK